MIKGKTTSGFEYEISDDINNDYELVEQLAELEENPFTLAKLITTVLGKEQAQKLKEHIRNDKGTVPTDKMTTELVEIFSNGDSKNS